MHSCEPQNTYADPVHASSFSFLSRDLNQAPVVAAFSLLPNVTSDGMPDKVLIKNSGPSSSLTLAMVALGPSALLLAIPKPNAGATRPTQACQGLKLPSVHCKLPLLAIAHPHSVPLSIPPLIPVPKISSHHASLPLKPVTHTYLI